MLQVTLILIQYCNTNTDISSTAGSTIGLLHLECTYIAVLAGNTNFNADLLPILTITKLKGMLKIPVIFLRGIDELQYYVTRLLSKVILL